MGRTGMSVALGMVGLFAAGVGGLSLLSRKEAVPLYRTVAVKRGDLLATLGATGTLEPEAAVDVGAQVAGVIVAFGEDKSGKPMNWGSTVEAGTVLARIDDSLYAAAVATAKAQVDQSLANVLATGANVLQQKANLLHASQDWARAQKLGPSDALAQSSYDQYRANFEVAKANLAAAEASVGQAKAAVEQARANLKTARINLDYCTIKSPVKGVVIDRRVNIGQTVVSSLSAPSLFLIADDLRRIQVWVAVNEADVGAMKPGGRVTFTVDAFPGKVFHGRVGQVRLNATMTQNVVTYTVEVDYDNSDGLLLPYLTANAQFVIGERKGVLLVPNAALRFNPQPGQVDRDGRREPPGGRHERGADSPGLRTLVYVPEGKLLRPLSVKAGLTDGAFTEVEGDGLAEGEEVVVGEGPRLAEAQAQSRNPFTPQIFRGPNRQGQVEPPGQEGQAPAPGAGR